MTEPITPPRELAPRPSNEIGTDPLSAEQVLSKLPAITLAFWIMKICATTLGETAGDMLSMTLKIGYAASSVILLTLFALALTAQLRSTKRHPFLYWLVILATSTAGTTMSDFMDRRLDLGYMLGSAILVTLLLTVLLVWKLTERSLSVTNVRSLRGEIFYWSAILVSNTLGTALGDFLSDDSGLGFARSAALVGGLIALIAVLHFTTKLSRTALFWCAFVLTRPFGAEMGDVLTKAPAQGGVGFGTIGSSAVLGAVLVGMIWFTHRRVQALKPPPLRAAADS
jgi:uncharacterized membrane-anchored protein